MLYAGLDIHKAFCQAIVMTESGEIVKEGKINTSRRAIQAFFVSTERIKVAIESTGIWDPIYDWLENLGHEVYLAHPLKTKAIAYARVKTDKVDAKTLADLLRANLLPQSYVPEKWIRELKSICRERKNMVCERTRWKNRVSAELAKYRIKCPLSNLYTKSGREWLLSLGIAKINRMVALDRYAGRKDKRA